MGADGTLERARFDRLGEVGVYARDEGVVLVAHDLVVQQLSGRASDLGSGRGIELGVGTDATLERVVVEDAKESGILVTGVGAHAALRDVTIRRVAHNAAGVDGRGIGVQYGALVELVRAHVQDAAGSAFVVTTTGTTLAASDVAVDWSPDVTGERGLSLDSGAVADLARVAIEGGSEVGVAAIGAGTSARLRDLLVREVSGRATDGLAGYGLAASGGGALSIARAEVTRARIAGALAVDPGSVLDLTDTVVAETLPAACATSTCSAAAGGFGIAAHGGGVARASRFLVLSSALAGVLVGPGGAIDLAEGEVAGAPIGANVQVDRYDLRRLDDRVLYQDNGRNLDTSALPAPSGLSPIAAP